VLCGGDWYDGYRSLTTAAVTTASLLCGGDVGVGLLWGGEWYDGVLELDGGVG
jgi:hypothetical protein